ncbi:patatin-like phospholipase family protein [Onishia taeanensis]
MAEPKTIDLALQGGGAHGAFTWGVLDKLLEDPRIRIEGISGTSAGAMNAVIMADALTRGDETTAREALERFWRAVSRAAMASPIRRSPLDVLTGTWSLDHSPGFLWLDLMTRLVSPYQFNPMNLNPLRDLLIEHVDFARVRACEDLKLFVCATSVTTGRQRIFRRAEMSADAVMASACLPFLFQAVEIDGEAFWDGGYTGNPPLLPLMAECTTRDIVIVQINPIRRDEVPTDAPAILNRLNEITFNASLNKEIRLVALLKDLAGELDSTYGCYRDALFHRISADEALAGLSVSSKMNAEWPFLCRLMEQGRAVTADWLDAHHEALGTRSTLDIEAIYPT